MGYHFGQYNQVDEMMMNTLEFLEVSTCYNSILMGLVDDNGGMEHLEATMMQEEATTLEEPLMLDLGVLNFDLISIYEFNILVLLCTCISSLCGC